MASKSESELGPLFEGCALCENLYPSSEMVDIYVRDKHGRPMPVRFCRRCAYPKITYIVGHLRLPGIDVPRILGLALGLTIAALIIVFAEFVGGSLGVFIALAGILAGTGISLAFAVSVAMHRGGESST